MFVLFFDFYAFQFVFEVSHWMRIKFRAEVAYLEVGSSDLEQIHEKTIFDDNQVFLLVRGGLRRKILVENDILKRMDF